jgi:RNA polymerase sigma-70 factor (ECF subfamily)
MIERPISLPRPLPAAEQPATGQAFPGIGGWAREYAADLHRFLSKRQFIESDIKDVCQEVYLRLLRFERTEVIQNPMAYLFRVAANVAHDFRLRQVQWTPLEEEQLEEPATDPGPEQLLDTEYRNRRLAEMLGTLPPLSRAALVLHSQEELTYEEIAARLGVTRRVVKRAIARGYALAREYLGKDGVI